MLLTDTASMRSSGFDPSTIEEAEARNRMIDAFLKSPIGDHLRSTEGKEIEIASGGRLLGADAIKDEVTECEPGAFLLPRGYIPVWSSIGGNLVVYGLEAGHFYWADRGGWNPDGGIITIPETYETIPFTEEDVPRALIEVSDDPPSKFIDDLKAGSYEERFDELD